MSHENVRALRAVYGEWAEGNFSAGGGLFAPEIVFEPFPERASIHGLESVIAYMREFLTQWSDYRVEAHDFVERNDSVVVTERQYATGKSSGIETVQTFYAVWTFGHGRVARVRWEDDRDTALEAVALRGYI